MKHLLDQATAFHTQGKFDEAEKLYRAVLAVNADQPDALALLGVLLSARQKHDQAIALLQHAVRVDPSAALFHFYLGNAQAARKDMAQAALAFAAAVERKPDFGEAWLGLSESALKNGAPKQAHHAAAQAVRLLPQNLAAFVALGLALDLLGREEEAIEAFQQALRLKPDLVAVQDMIGTTYQNLNRLDEAEASFRAAIASAGCALADKEAREVDENEYAIQHWNLALLELLRGDFKNGFAHYRARFKNPNRPPRLPFPRHLWRGEDLREKKILIVGEQGFGDVLMLCRYAPLLQQRGAHVTLLAHQALLPLLATANLADALISEAPAAQNNFDFQTSIFDLPLRFGTTVETIPAPVPYIPTPAADEATRLPQTGKPRIGVVWAGRPDYGNDRRRSVPLEIFSALFQKTGPAFFSLMREQRAGDAEILARYGIADLGPLLNDFLATARIIGQLDLVITCDTSVAHLAGAMGRKVWVLLPFAPDWRWLTGREDSPWYPSMRLFRQHKKGDWAELVTRVGAALDRETFPSATPYK